LIGAGLIYAWVLDGKGGGRRLADAEIDAWKPADGLLWLHLDYTETAARKWLKQRSGLDRPVVNALRAEETRPRSQAVGDGLLLSLRGINLNPGADPEDMVAVRVYADATRIITTRRRRLMSAQNIDTSLAAGEGPKNTGEFIVQLSSQLVIHMRETIDNADDRVSEIEEMLVQQADQRLRRDLSELRREAIALRRYLAPQRDAMLQLQGERVSWLSETDRQGVREVMDHLMRYLEDLDSVRDRAAVMHEELANQLSEQLNQRMYVLSLVAAFFLPLGFLTGLLGINVGGIPGADEPWAFYIFIVLLIVVVGLQIWLFQRKRWL
jgi:zinc transporter